MGLLDDAIREHLDLKRRRGADPTEVEREEREVLGPVRQRAEQPGADDHGFVDEHEPLAHDEDVSWANGGSEYASSEAEEQPAFDHEQEPEPYGDAGRSPGRERYADLGRGPEPYADAGRVAEPYPDAGRAPEPYADAGRAPEPEPYPDAGRAPEPYPDAGRAPEPYVEARREPDPYPSVADETHDPGQSTVEYSIEPAEDAPPTPVEGEKEDVLEETPEFLQDTPDHDRLWFEQRPPRDFDFDG